MRIATASRYDSSVATLQERQAELTRLQQQLSSGKRISTPSDDPVGAARAERAYIAQQRIGASQRSVQASRNAMSLAESALGSAVDLLQSARETIASAGNGSYGPTDRAALAAQLKQLRSQLLAVANQSDGNGGHVFGGQGNGSEPFLDGAGGVRFAGSAGQTMLPGTDALPASLDGQAIWLGARSGNGVFTTAADPANTGQGWIDAGGVTDPAALTGHDVQIVFSVSGGSTTYSVLDNGAPTAIAGAAYSPGATISIDGMAVQVSGQPADGDRFTIAPSSADLDPFAVLDRAIGALGNPDANPGQVAQAVSDGLRDIDAVMGQVQGARSAAGATLARLDQLDQRNQDQQLAAQTAQSNAEDVDMVQAVSEFQSQQTSYQAALQSYAIVQRLSLFDYLK